MESKFSTLGIERARHPNWVPRNLGNGPVVPPWYRRPEDRQAERETAHFAELSTEAPRIPWDVFVTQELNWLPDEHFGLIGPTGQGKTTMMLNVIQFHPYVTVFASKPRDKTMDALQRTGYIKLDRWRSLDADEYPHRILWPSAHAMDSRETQKDAFRYALERIYREGGWTVCIDEMWYMSNILKMKEYIKIYLTQARSLGISMLMCTQRPANVPLELYDMSTHLMFWRDNDETNLKRMAGIGWRSQRLIRRIVSNLEDHQVLYINTRTGKMIRTRCPDVRLP